MTSTPTLAIETALTPELLDDLLPQIVGRFLEPFIVSQRWYGDKARELRRIHLVASSVVPHHDSFFVLLGAGLSFDAGDRGEYFVPLTVTTLEAANSAAIAEIHTPDVVWRIRDAVQSPAFRRWLLRELDRERTDPSGRFHWTATFTAADPLRAAMFAESRVSSAQQSNSSIIYGDHVILKVFRRLAPGINPEIEIGRFLTTRTNFRNTPLLLGEWTYLGDGNPKTLAVAQSFVPNTGDGWSHVLRSLQSPESAIAADARRLGQLTAQLHLALESARTDGDLVPEPILQADVDGWTGELEQAIDSTARGLAAVAEREAGETGDLIDAFLGLAPRLKTQSAGFERLVGRTKQRVHGDYHLGQTLRTTDGDFVILDFEGEPQRPIEQRRTKTSPLKDVAGMLRSFGYARGATERQSAEQQRAIDRPALIAWERAARAAFIETYVEESRRGGARYLPTSDDDIRQALAAWELDKALYEVNYELNNRPDWLGLPLAATLKLT